MLKKIARRLVRLIPVALFGFLSGCASVIVGAYDQSRMTPDGLGISADQFRGYDCNTLKMILESQEQGYLNATDSVEQKVYKFQIDAVNQVRVEQACTSGSQQKNLTNSPSPVSAESPRGVIGVQMGELTAEVAKAMAVPSSGVLVVEVMKGLPAEKAGMKPMDAIIEVAGQPVKSIVQVQNIIGSMRVGYKAEIQIWRDRARKTLMVEIASNAQLPTVKSPDVPKAAQANPRVGDVEKYFYCYGTDVSGFVPRTIASHVFPFKVQNTQISSYHFAESFAAEFKRAILLPQGLNDPNSLCPFGDSLSAVEQMRNSLRHNLRLTRFDEINWRPSENAAVKTNSPADLPQNPSRNQPLSPPATPEIQDTKSYCVGIFVRATYPTDFLRRSTIWEHGASQPSEAQLSQYLNSWIEQLAHSDSPVSLTQFTRESCILPAGICYKQGPLQGVSHEISVLCLQSRNALTTQLNDIIKGVATNGDASGIKPMEWTPK